MAYRVHQLNKKTGVTYVYEAVSVWNKELRQSRNKQVCIGKIDPVTGQFIPSKRLDPAQAAFRDPAAEASVQVVGPSFVLDTIADRIGLKSIIESVFPVSHQELLSMAFFLTCQGGPLSYCSSWVKSHAPELADSLTLQRIGELLTSISTDKNQAFFAGWMKKHMENSYLCSDIRSVTSYSELNEFFKNGANRDGEKLPQLNLAVLFAQKSGLPVWYHRMAATISDVSSLHKLLQPFRSLDTGRMHYVMDKGFYSKENIDDLLGHRDHFTVLVPLNEKWVQQAIDEVHQTIHGPDGYRKLDDEILYVHSRLYPWGESRRRCYLHLYYNATNRARAVDDFNEALYEYRQEVESGKPVAEHQKAYDEFLVVKTTSKRGVSVSFNAEAINCHISRYAGFQALLSMGINDPVEAMRVYRDRDAVEESFDDLMNSLDMKKLEMHSGETIKGRLFVQFIALTLFIALRKQMRDTGLIEKYTVQELLGEMESLARINYSGNYGHILTGVTESQKDILKALDMPIMNSA
jgi:transposase